MSAKTHCEHGEHIGNACPICEWNAGRSFAAPAGSPAPIPDVLFDGNAVWRELDERAKTRTSAENVSDVLDAIVRLMRRSVQENSELSDRASKT